MKDRKAITLLVLAIAVFTTKAMVFSESLTGEKAVAQESAVVHYKKAELPPGVEPAEPLAAYPRNQKVRIYKNTPPVQHVERVTLVEPVSATAVKTYKAQEPVTAPRIIDRN